MSKLIKTINERIKEEGGADEAIELNLSSLELTSINKDVRKVLDKAKGIQVLVISENSLDSLETLPDWNLSSLDLGSNAFADESLKKINKFPDLIQLILSDNKIKTLTGLQPLFALKNLEDLDISGNPVAEIPGYRELLFEKIPKLASLDGLDRDGNAVEDELDDELVDAEDGSQDGDDSDQYSDDDDGDSDEETKKK